MSSILGLSRSRNAVISRCEVCEMLPDGSVVANIDDTAVICDLLDAGRGHLTLNPGDVVLVWTDEGARHPPVILGRIADAHPEPRGTAEQVQVSEGGRVPDSLLIEANESMTLRVGDGCITIRADGKILIKGKDLVSHAQRVNRIKGGSVAIN